MSKENPEHSLSAKVVDHPWKTIAASLAVVCGVGFFMRDVAPSISYKDLLGEDYPLLRVYETIQSEYTNDDNLLVLVEAQHGDAFTAEILTGVRRLTDELWKTPFSVRVDSVTNFQHSEAQGDDLHIADLVGEQADLSDAGIAKIKHIALHEPLLVNRVVNPAANVLAINVSFAFANESASEKLGADAYVQTRAAQFRREHPQTNVYVAGLVALDATVLAISLKETGMLLGLVIVIVLVLMTLLLKRWVQVIPCLLVFIFSMMASMALSGMMGWKLTPFTSSVPMIVLIIAVADCVHYLTNVAQRLSAGESKRAALVDALRVTARPIVITSVTTAVGLLTLRFSESEGIRALGSQSAFGVMFACGLTLTFLPALLAVLPIKVGARPMPATERFEGITDFLFRNRVSLLAASTLLAVLLGYGASRNEFNDRIPTYFDKSLPWRVANDFSEEQFGGAYTFSYSVNSKKADGVADPEFLRKVEEFADWLKSLPEVAYVSSVADTFKRLNKNMHGDDPEFYRLPTDRAQAAQYLLLYEMSLPYGLDLNDQITIDKSGTKVLAAFKTMSTSEVLETEKKVNAWIENNMANIDVQGSGVQIMFAHLLNQDTRGLIMGAVYGLIVISFLLVFILRSFKIGFISIMPNLLPAMFAFGVWGLFVGQVGMGLAMVSGMSIGIIVDDTVHFLTKYLKARREVGLDARSAVSYTFAEVGRSIVFTTVILVAGFVVMGVISEFRVNADMGRMTAMIMVFALVFDLITLPILLMIFDRPKVPARTLQAARA